MDKPKKVINYQKELIIQSSLYSSYLRFLKKHNKNLYKPAVSHYLDYMKKTFIERAESYTFNFSGSVCTKLYSIYPSHDLGVPIIAVDILIDTEMTQNDFKNILKEAKLMNQRIRTIHFYLSANGQAKSFFNKIKDENIGHAMIAFVQTSYRYLKTFEFSSDVRIEKLKENEVKKIINLEMAAHSQSKTSRCSSLGKINFQEFYSFCFKKKSAMFVAKEGLGHILGIIVVSISKDKLGHIMTIAVDPPEQKRGVSTFLYFHAMKYFKEKGVKAYLGVSSTSEVLKMGKKMGRHTHSQYLEVSY